MPTGQSTDDLLSFLQQACDSGLMPAATAQALMVACRNVFDVLRKSEQGDVGVLDVDDAISRFTNKRGKDFNPASVKEYGRRVRRAVELFLAWRRDPASVKVRTRTSASSSGHPVHLPGDAAQSATRHVFEYPQTETITATSIGNYQTSFPLRPGHLITLSNIPQDLTRQEADRIAAFIGMLALD